MGPSTTVDAHGPDALNDPDALMPPASVAQSYWQVYEQPRCAWTFEMEIMPFKEPWRRMGWANKGCHVMKGAVIADAALG